MSREYLSNYIYVLNYEYSLNYSYDGTGQPRKISLYAIDTHYMVTCTIDSNELQDLVNSRRVIIRNLNQNGIINTVDKGQKVVLFKCDNGNYMVSDYYCNLSIMTLQKLKENNESFPDVKFVGKGITTGSGKVPNINKRAIDIYKMQNFNTKAALIGLSTLDFDFDYNNNLIITGIRDERDRVEIPNFATYITNRAFLNTNIKHVNIGNGVKEIGSNAFAGCSNLESVLLGENVEAIDNRAFFGCKKLSQLVVNDKLKYINAEAFAYTKIDVLNRQIYNLRVTDELREKLEIYDKIK